jgi:hypothetical protein
MNKPAVDQAVLVYIPSAVAFDLAFDEIEDPLIEAIREAAAGEFDGNEIGPAGTTLYMYGPSADVIFEVVVPILRDAGVPSVASVTRRYGGPGSPEITAALG